MSLKWSLAYYVPLDDYVSVDYLIGKRKAGELPRSGDCYDSREAFNEGDGIRLGPNDYESGSSGRRNFISSHPGQMATIRRRAHRTGYNFNPSRIDEFQRFVMFQSSLLISLSTDEDIQKHCQIESAVIHPRSGQMDAPDIVITHSANCILGEQTNIVITDRNRIRHLPESGTLELRINDWTQEHVGDFERFGRTLFLRYWNRRVRKEESNANRIAAEAEANRIAAEAEANRIAAEAEANRIAAEAEAEAETNRIAELNAQSQRISDRKNLWKRAVHVVDEWMNQAVPSDMNHIFPDVICLRNLSKHQYFPIQKDWVEGLQGNARLPIARAENSGKVEMPRRYADFSDLVRAAEANLQSVRERLTHINGDMVQRRQEVDLISSSGDRINHISREYRALQVQINNIRSTISNLQIQTFKAVRRNSRLSTDITEDASSALALSHGRDRTRELKLEVASEEVRSFIRNSLNGFKVLHDQVKTSVQELGLTGDYLLPDEYWWDEEINRENDLQRIATEMDKLSNRLDTAITGIQEDWKARLPNYEGYLPGCDHYIAHLDYIAHLNKLRERTDRARTPPTQARTPPTQASTPSTQVQERNDNRLRGKVRCLVGPNGRETHGWIMQRVGGDVLFSLDEVIGQAVSSADEVRYAVVRERARNRAVRVELVPLWVPPWRLPVRD